MQWSKAKTYLIIAFIITDLLLIASIIEDKSSSMVRLDKSQINAIMQILSEKNIKVDFKLQNKVLKLPPIKIQYSKLDKQRYDEIFKSFPKNNIQIVDNKYLELNIPEVKNMDKDKFIEYCNSFLEKYLPENKYIFKQYSNNEDNQVLVYDQEYDGFFIEEGYAQFAYGGNTVTVSIYNVNVSDYITTSLPTITMTQALAKALPQLQNNSVIDKIDLGYKNISQSPLDNPSTVIISPVWRIQTDLGDIYVKAYSH